MSDPNDEASELEQAHRESAINAASMKAGRETHPDFDGEHCVHCGDPIHPLRLEMGRVRCVYCQSALERGIL
jgi:RNA polymerase-binding transcription factor DksA